MEKFIGIPYRFWTPQYEESVYEQCNTLPLEEDLKETGVCCSGLINLFLLNNNKQPIGGTEKWFEYLTSLQTTVPLNDNILIPTGSLVFSNYQDETTQGHIAYVVSDSKNSYNSTIIHSIGRYPIENTLVYGPGVIEEPLINSIEMYTHVSLGTDWLEKI